MRDNPDASDKLPNQEMLDATIKRKAGRFIYKMLRVLYASFIFYFLPYSSLFIPYVAVSMQTGA